MQPTILSEPHQLPGAPPLAAASIASPSIPFEGKKGKVFDSSQTCFTVQG